MSDTRHTYFCLGGPLDGQRYAHRFGQSFLVSLIGETDFQYVEVAVAMPDGPVSFWAPRNATPEFIMGKLLRAIPSAALVDLVAGR